METTENNTIEGRAQPKFRDRLFIAIFGKDTERSKRWRLDLYNVLNGTSYTDPNVLELNTIENVIYIKMYNDVSFLVDSQMTLYEQQSRALSFFTTDSRNARSDTNCVCQKPLSWRTKAVTSNGLLK